VTTATARRAATARAPAPKKTTTAPKSNQRRASAKAGTPGRQQPSTDLAGNAPRTPVEHAVLAAEQALRRNSLFLRIPVLGALTLPAPEQVAFIGGVAVVAVIGLLDWPVAVLLVIGHGVATQSHRKMVRALGEALEAG